MPTLDTTIETWRDAYDLVAWPKLAEHLAERFEVNVPRSSWQHAFEPESQQTLRSVCELIARQGTVPVFVPQKLGGTQCEAAGAFLSIRKLLQVSGVDVRGLRPSTPIAPFLETHPGVFAREILPLAPGRVRPPEVPVVWSQGSLASACVCVVLLAAGILLPVVVLLSWFFRGPEPRMTLPKVETFSDLARALSKSSRWHETIGRLSLSDGLGHTLCSPEPGPPAHSRCGRAPRPSDGAPRSITNSYT